MCQNIKFYILNTQFLFVSYLSVCQFPHQKDGEKKNIQENSQKTVLKLSFLHAEQSAGAPDTFKHKVQLPSKVTVSAEIQKTKSAKTIVS